MKRIVMISLLALSLFAVNGCTFSLKNVLPGVDVQIVSDSQLMAPGESLINDLVTDIKIKHPEQVQKYLAYCDRILNETDMDKVETYINFGLDYIIDSNVSNKLTAAALKGMFEIKVDGTIDFDSGAMRIALDLVRILRDSLSIPTYKERLQSRAIMNRKAFNQLLGYDFRHEAGY